MAYGASSQAQPQMSVYAPQQARPRSSRSNQGDMDPGQAAAQFQAQYGRAPTQQDVQRFQQASGWSGQGTISQQQYQQGMNAMGGYMQQEGNLGAVYMPTPGAQPTGPQNFQTSVQQGQQLFGPPPQLSPLQPGVQQVTQQQMRQSAPQYQPYAAPTPVVQQERNALLGQMASNPDVFGATQQAQLFEQQKELLQAQKEQAANRLSQTMLSRGLSARGGTDLMGQAGLEDAFTQSLLAGQRDIALQSAEKNQASRQNVLNAILGTQQADQGMAAQNFQTGLEGFRANVSAQQQQDAQALQAAQFANLIGQQGFQNYLAQSGLTLQGIGMAEQAELARTQNEQRQYQDMLSYLLQARGQEQDYALGLRRQGATEQDMMARLYGFGG